MSNMRGLERIMPVLGAEPADFNGGATTGDYFDMAAYERCLIIFGYGDGSAGSDPQVSVHQSDDNSGTTTAVLNALQTGTIYRMQAATYAAYAALTAYSKITQATADEKYEPTDNGEAVGIIALEIKAADLTDGYRYIRCDVTDPGASKVCFLLYIGLDPKFAAAPELMDVGF